MQAIKMKLQLSSVRFGVELWWLPDFVHHYIAFYRYILSQMENTKDENMDACVQFQINS